MLVALVDTHPELASSAPIVRRRHFVLDEVSRRRHELTSTEIRQRQQRRRRQCRRRQRSQRDDSATHIESKMATVASSQRMM